MPLTETNELCPHGHLSSEPDYCSECGVRLAGTVSPATETGAGPSKAAAAKIELCPDCGTLREQPGIVFCEVCGLNFVSGARGEIPSLTPVAAQVPLADEPEALAAEPPPSEAPPPLPETAAAIPEPVHPSSVPQWRVLVAVDPVLRGEQSPAAPVGFMPFTVVLDRPATLLGRRDEVRGINPEIALTHDEAVSRRHALLLLDPTSGELLLRDIGASNGTRLNGRDLAPMVDHPLKAGDQITLGHWSRLQVNHD